MLEAAPLRRTAFGPYQVRDLIAVSGMGVVYRAWDPRLECLVAIKLVNEKTVSDESARQQLLKEARIASSLDHQNICRIKHVEEADGQTGIVMELVEGLALDRLIPPGAGLPFEEVVRYGIEIAAAIAHAHQHKVVHRDLKSGNVMVTAEGRIKLLDFGLSKVQLHTDVPVFLSPPSSGASSHTIVGTPPYWAPEVLKRAPSDARSDLWSFGVLLYEMASGGMPFQGKTLVELGSAILRDPPQPLPSGVPIELAKIIQRCLLKEPSQRYQRASEIRADLEALHSDRGLSGAGKWKWPDLLKVSKSSRLSRRLSQAASQGGIRSVAVLPLDNISGSADQEYFADGLTESLITTLAKVSGLRIISRTSIMRYKRVRKSVPQIARELGADVIVEGSVLRVGDRVRITAELIQGATDEHLWAESYERDLRDIFALQSQVALAIAGEIRAKLSPEKMPTLGGWRWLEGLGAEMPSEQTVEISVSQPPVDPKAYDLYLKGRHLWNIDKDVKAVAYYQQAIVIDPSSALTYAALAHSLIRMGIGEFGLVAPTDIMPKAKSAALEALNLDETLAEAHISLAMLRFRYEGDWAGAETEFVRAIELKDSDAAAHYTYSIYLMASSRFDDALREVKLAQQLNPLSPTIHFSLGLLLYLSGQHEEAAEQLRGTTAIYPTFPLAHLVLGLALESRGKFDDAIAAMKQSLTIAGDVPLWRGLLGHTCALAGRTDEALKILQELLAALQQRYVPPVAIALVYAGLGKLDDAFLWLDRSCLERDGLLVYLKVAAAFDGLRRDPRFPPLLTRLGFEENMKRAGTDVSQELPPVPVSYKEQLERLRGPKTRVDEPPGMVTDEVKRVAYPLLAVITLLAVAATAGWLLRPSAPTNVVLAVRPFKNLSGDPEAQQTAEGLTEEMVSGFGLLHPKRLSVLELAPAAASTAGAQTDVQFKSAYLLQGTVQVVQHKVAVTAQLILTADQTRVWGDSYERVIRDPEDIIAIEIEIAGLVRNEVLAQLPKDLHPVHQENPQAYESYIEGRYFWNKRTTESLKKAVTYFETSIQQDPDYAPAYAGLADCYSLLGSVPHTFLRPQEAFPKAEAAARKALELDPSLAEANVSLAYADLTYEHDYPKAEQEFQQALRLRPNYATAHQYYGYYLTAMGQLKDAIRERQEARDLDPLSPLLNSALGEAYYHARDYDRTIEANQKALNLDPGFAIAMINLARAFEEKKMYPQAGGIFQQMLAAAPDEPAVMALVGHDDALAGNPTAALKLLSQLQTDASTRYVPALYFAMIYTGLGDKTQAFQWLNKAYDERCDYLINLPSEPFADPLRGDPRFGELLGRLGLNQIPESPQ